MVRQDQESLHRKASADYLNGDFRAALESWRRLLELQPDDERALEGVRLCEQLAGAPAGNESGAEPGGASAVAESRETAAAVADREDDRGDTLQDCLEELKQPDFASQSSAAAELNESIDGAIDDFLDLSDLDPGSTAEPALAAIDTSGLDEPKLEPVTPQAAPTGEPVQDSEPSLDVFDLDDGLADRPAGMDPEVLRETSARVSPVMPEFAAVVEDEAALDEEVVEEAVSEPGEHADDDAEGAEGEASAALRRRANELLANALIAMEEGDDPKALSILDRLLILDDENETALSLKEKIQLQAESSAPESTTAEPPADEPAILTNDALLDLDGLDAAATEQPPAEPVAPRAVAEPAPETVLAPEPDGAQPGDLPVGFGEDLEAEIDLPPVAPVAPAGVGAALQRLPKWMWLAAAGVIVAGAGFWAWQSFSVEARPGPELIAGKPTKVDEGTEQSGEGGAETEAAGEGRPAGAATAGATADLTAALSSGRRAFDSGDYAAALMAYDQVLKLDPGNAEAVEQIRVAGARFREQKAQEQKWNAAIEAFESMDYTTALHTFYRVAPGDRADRVDRYKVNSWYNFGLMALKSGNCDGAESRFNEARGLKPDDAGVAQGLELVEGCRGQKNASYRRQLDGLDYRGLDD